MYKYLGKLRYTYQHLVINMHTKLFVCFFERMMCLWLASSRSPPRCYFVMFWRTMKISSCTLAFLLSNSLASSAASPWTLPHRCHWREAFVSHGVVCRSATGLPYASEGNGGEDTISFDDTPCDSNQSIKVPIEFSRKIRSNLPSTKLMGKVATAGAAITAFSSSLPLSAFAATNQAYDTIQTSSLESPMILSALDSSSVFLSLGDVAAGLQFLYTAVLVTGVGYTQRMAGREDFKKDMAMKIANGEITPEEVCHICQNLLCLSSFQFIQECLNNCEFLFFSSACRRN